MTLRLLVVLAVVFSCSVVLPLSLTPPCVRVFWAGGQRNGSHKRQGGSDRQGLDPVRAPRGDAAVPTRRANRRERPNIWVDVRP